MVVLFNDLVFQVFEAKPDDDPKDAPDGPGWYWQECRVAECGPFNTLPEVLADMTAWVVKHYAP